MIPLTPEQATAIAHLAALHGKGEVREHDGQLGWVWFKTGHYDWCLAHDGGLLGWNDDRDLPAE